MSYKTSKLINELMLTFKFVVHNLTIFFLLNFVFFLSRIVSTQNTKMRRNCSKGKWIPMISKLVISTILNYKLYFISNSKVFFSKNKCKQNAIQILNIIKRQINQVNNDAIPSSN